MEVWRRRCRSATSRAGGAAPLRSSCSSAAPTRVQPCCFFGLRVSSATPRPLRPGAATRRRDPAPRPGAAAVQRDRWNTERSAALFQACASPGEDAGAALKINAATARDSRWCLSPRLTCEDAPVRRTGGEEDNRRTDGRHCSPVRSSWCSS